MYNVHLRPFEFCGAPQGLLCSFSGLYLFVLTWGISNLLHWTLSPMFSQKSSGLQFQLSARPTSARSTTARCPLSVVPTGGAVYPMGAYTGLTFLNFFPETNGLCWGTAAGKEEKKKNLTLFYYSKVHFNLHKRHCVCDGLHKGKHYSPASLARKKIERYGED